MSELERDTVQRGSGSKRENEKGLNIFANNVRMALESFATINT